MLLAYKFNITGEEGDYVVTFPDIPEALTGAETRQEAIELARDCLLEALDGYIKGNEVIPYPRSRVKGTGVVYLRPVEASKVALYNAMKEQDMTRVALADHLDVAVNTVQRWLQLSHNSKVNDINTALRIVFKKRLVTTLMDVA